MNGGIPSTETLNPLTSPISPPEEDDDEAREGEELLQPLSQAGANDLDAGALLLCFARGHRRRHVSTIPPSGVSPISAASSGFSSGRSVA
jgi:hypothetical protein